MLRLLAALVASAWLAAAADPPKENAAKEDDAKEMKRFIDALRILEENAVDPIDARNVQPASA